MIRRRLLNALGLEENEVKEWKVLLDQTVTDNNIFYYTVDAQGCKEFYVSVFFTNDPEITSTINGIIALNADASPWDERSIKVSRNIANLVYSASGNNSKAVILGFEVTNGIIIPTRMFSSYNTGGSSAALCTQYGDIALGVNKSGDNNQLSYKIIDEIKNISVGSYTKYFGVGSKILILGR